MGSPSFGSPPVGRSPPLPSFPLPPLSPSPLLPRLLLPLPPHGTPGLSQAASAPLSWLIPQPASPLPTKTSAKPKPFSPSSWPTSKPVEAYPTSPPPRPPPRDLRAGRLYYVTSALHPSNTFIELPPKPCPTSPPTSPSSVHHLPLFTPPSWRTPPPRPPLSTFTTTPTSWIYTTPSYVTTSTTSWPPRASYHLRPKLYGLRTLLGPQRPLQARPIGELRALWSCFSRQLQLAPQRQPAQPLPRPCPPSPQHAAALSAEQPILQRLHRRTQPQQLVAAGVSTAALPSSHTPVRRSGSCPPPHLHLRQQRSPRPTTTAACRAQLAPQPANHSVSRTASQPTSRPNARPQLPASRAPQLCSGCPSRSRCLLSPMRSLPLMRSNRPSASCSSAAPSKQRLLFDRTFAAQQRSCPLPPS